MWWDEHAGKYRISLIHKLFYVWGWPIIRAVMFRLPCETAHHLAIRSLCIVEIIDTIWSWIVALAILFVVLLFRLIAFLPGFRWEVTTEQELKP
jgi:hypothetical protein